MVLRLFLINCLLLLSITISFSQQTTDDTEPTKKDWKHSFDWGIDAMAFGRTTSLVDEIGSLNPNNRIAKLSQWNSGLYLRPDLYYSNIYFEVSAKPRLNFDIKEKMTYGYDDVPPNAWFANYAGAAQTYNLFPDANKFLNPQDEMSRNDVAIAIYQFLKNR